MLSVRAATPDDIRAWHGRDIQPEWYILPPFGYVAERDVRSVWNRLRGLFGFRKKTELVAMGIVSWDACGRAWGYFHAREHLPVTMHRTAKETLALLREVGEPALYAFCSLTIVGSEKWLSRLGFRPDPDLSTPEFPVWKCALN